MNIFYVILSGAVFKDTRNVWAQETWLKALGEGDDYAFLEGKTDSDRKVLGFDTPEGHFTSFLKLRGFYLHYLENKEKYDNYDWFLFADSDTYVYCNKAREYLEKYSLSSDSPLFIGRLNMLPNHENPKHGPGAFGGTTRSQIFPYFCNHVGRGPWYCHNGGAGWALNRAAVEKMGTYLAECGGDFPWSQHYDLANSLWVNDCDIPMLHSRLFRSQPKSNHEEFCDYMDHNVITFHYVEEQDFYNLYEESEKR